MAIFFLVHTSPFLSQSYKKNEHDFVLKRSSAGTTAHHHLNSLLGVSMYRLRQQATAGHENHWRTLKPPAFVHFSRLGVPVAIDTKCADLACLRDPTWGRGVAILFFLTGPFTFLATTLVVDTQSGANWLQKKRFFYKQTGSTMPRCHVSRQCDALRISRRRTRPSRPRRSDATGPLSTR